VNASDRTQFEEFMASRWPGLVRLAFGLTGDRWLAEDLAQTALARLPPRQRAVVVLRYVEDMTDAQVGALLGCSASTVRSQAARALAKLRASEELEDTDPGGTSPPRHQEVPGEPR
jgi:DNA-directed RNA polymerase specialized sigma24 family protein